MARRISSLKFSRVNFDRLLLWARRLSVHAQASGRLSGKCSDTIPLCLFAHSGDRGELSAAFGISKAQKLLLEMSAMNARRRSDVCSVGP